MSLTPTRSLRLLTVATAVLVAACSSDSPVEPTGHQPADLSQVLTEATLPEAASVVSAVAIAPMPLTLSAPTPANCTFDGSSTFVCPTVTAEGITITHSYTLLDASGTAQSHFDPATTAAVRTTSTAVGTLTTPNSSLNIDDRRVMTVSGLLAERHVLDGTEVSKLDGTFGGFASGPSTMTTTTAGVVLPKSGTSERWPLSGSITTVGTSQSPLAGLLDPTITVKITFNGTSKVPLTFSGGGFSQSCMMDLTGQTAPACS